MELVEALQEKVDNVEESTGKDHDIALIVTLKSIAVRLDYLSCACQAALSGVDRVGL